MRTVDTLHTWVINLDRAPQRLERIGAQLDALGVAWTRFPAVEGKGVPASEQAALLDRSGFERRHGMTPSLGELGCYLSHVRLMQAFLDTAHEFALILEDDAQPTAALPEVLRGLMAARGRWDMVKLSAIHSGSPIGVMALGPGHQLGVMFSRCTGSSAYVINRAAAQRYVQRLLPMQLPYDHAYDRGWVYGLKVRRVFPEVCVHDDQVESTIGNPGPSRKFVWNRRLPTYAHRLGTELQRFGYGVAQLLWHRS
ncbi:MAG: glycosyltransferase family 25 protein [Betaproteobacteria bacterium]|nr:glycosyltransferase family 25 protein [Betaproteobacteria bacterium]NBX96962.1 glycosyltransferase family 25 protein [Betaproteobacteria bacterium]